MRRWHRSSASWPGSCARTSRKNCRCCSGMCRRISSGASPASRFAGAAGPPAPRWRTSRSTWGTNAPISCRATRASSSCAVSMRCARVSIAWLRASSCSPRGAAHRDGSRLPVKLRVLLRLIEIQRVLLRHRLDDYVRATHLYRPLRFVFFLSPGVWFERRRGVSRAARLRLALEELGPIFVKFGQAVSTRRDLLPADIADELAHRDWAEGGRVRPRELVAEYHKTILDELDLMREAANASQLKRNFAASELLYVPEVHWDYCRTDVMVMERIHGVPISERSRLHAAGADIAQLAENGVRIFFTQVFRHNFFHADMHPGNIFVLVDDPQRPRYAAVDFGIVGTLDPGDQNYLAENFLAVFDRDYRRGARLDLQSGWVPAGTPVGEMDSAARTVCEPVFRRPLTDLRRA